MADVNHDIAPRVDRLMAVATAERLRYDAALFSDIWKGGEGRFEQFAKLYGSTGSWDDGDGEGGFEWTARHRREAGPIAGGIWVTHRASFGGNAAHQCERSRA